MLYSAICALYAAAASLAVQAVLYHSLGAKASSAGCRCIWNVKELRALKIMANCARAQHDNTMYKPGRKISVRLCIKFILVTWRANTVDRRGLSIVHRV